jgi:hypothetical protein
MSFLLYIAAEVLNYLFLQSLFRFAVLPWGFCFIFFPFPLFLRKLFPLEIRLNFRQFQVGALGGSVYVFKEERSLSFPWPALGSGQPAFSFLFTSSFLLYFIST